MCCSLDHEGSWFKVHTQHVTVTKHNASLLWHWVHIVFDCRVCEPYVNAGCCTDRAWEKSMPRYGKAPRLSSKPQIYKRAPGVEKCMVSKASHYFGSDQSPSCIPGARSGRSTSSPTASAPRINDTVFLFILVSFTARSIEGAWCVRGSSRASRISLRLAPVWLNPCTHHLVAKRSRAAVAWHLWDPASTRFPAPSIARAHTLCPTSSTVRAKTPPTGRRHLEPTDPASTPAPRHPPEPHDASHLVGRSLGHPPAPILYYVHQPEMRRPALQKKLGFFL